MSEFLKRTWAEIHLDRLQGNFQAIQASLAPGSQAMAVVKADGYGHGAAAAAKALREAGAAWFGVSNLEEAVQLRRAGIDGDILILSFTPPEEAGRLAEFAVTQTVLSRPYAEELDAAAQAAGVRVRVHLKVDTGMSRVGFLYHREGDEAVLDDMAAACRLPHLTAEGIFAHFASADEEDTASLGDDVSNVLRRLSRETLWGRPAARTIKVWSNTGEPLTLHIEREIVPDANGKPARVIGYLEDPLNDSRAKLTRSDDNRLLDILKGAAVDHWYINVNTKSFLNSADRRAWRYWAGISLDDWSSSMLEDRLGKYTGPSQDAEAIENFLDFDDMLQRFADGERNDSLEYRLGENDDERWMELSYRMVQLEEDGYVYAYLSVTDIDERKRRELDLENKAEHDALTGLLNRQSASMRMANALERTLQRGYRGAFAIIDLDDFKQVNDRYGHLSGDTVLADVAQHLCGAFRKGDLICRWGGDEFVVYCEDMERDDIERRLVELSEGPWNATLPDNRVIELSVSTGIAMVPQDGIAFKTVYERADRALYRAKSKGKAHFCFFEADKDS